MWTPRLKLWFSQLGTASQSSTVTPDQSPWSIIPPHPLSRRGFRCSGRARRELAGLRGCPIPSRRTMQKSTYMGQPEKEVAFTNPTNPLWRQKQDSALWSFVSHTAHVSTKAQPRAALQPSLLRNDRVREETRTAAPAASRPLHVHAELRAPGFLLLLRAGTPGAVRNLTGVWGGLQKPHSCHYKCFQGTNK